MIQSPTPGLGEIDIGGYNNASLILIEAASQLILATGKGNVGQVIAIGSADPVGTGLLILQLVNVYHIQQNTLVTASAAAPPANVVGKISIHDFLDAVVGEIP